VESKKLAEEISEIIFSKKGYDVKIIDLRDVTTLTDFFVICSADSDTQVKAIADEVDKKLRDDGVKSWHKEGYKALNWVLLDYVDVVAHVFKKDAREFYNLEKLWGDATIIEAVDPLLKAVEKKARKSPARKTAKAEKNDESQADENEAPVKKVRKTPVKKTAKAEDTIETQTDEIEAPAKKVRKTTVRKAGTKKKNDTTKEQESE
jgi:ribosome-associated protein